MIRVFIGFDQREAVAFHVAVASIMRHASEPVAITPLARGNLRHEFNRPRGPLDSTDFAISRFLVPHLCGFEGRAIFIDCDMLFQADVAELFALFDPRYAVQVVQHDHRPQRQTKMDGAAQIVYRRKNWSSVILWNCDHPGNRRLSLWDINHRPGRDLHALYWLADAEIGALPPEWNWLVGDQAKPVNVKLAHYTNGGPWFPNWVPSFHDDLWLEESRRGD